MQCTVQLIRTAWLVGRHQIGCDKLQCSYFQHIAAEMLLFQQLASCWKASHAGGCEKQQLQFIQLALHPDLHGAMGHLLV